MGHRITWFWLLSALVASAVATDRVQAQDDEEERAGESQGEYAWGSGPGQQHGTDPLRIQAFVGGGVGFRLVRNLDFNQEFLAPAYVDAGAALFLEGWELRHGVGLTVTTNVSSDAATDNSGVGILQQWGLTPSYHLLLPFQRLLGMDQDMFQLQFRVGVPVVFSPRRGPAGGMDVVLGGELAAAFNFKFLAGLGLYVEIQGTLYGGSDMTLHPVLAADAGLLFDYEVLP